MKTLRSRVKAVACLTRGSLNGEASRLTSRLAVPFIVVISQTPVGLVRCIAAGTWQG